MPRVDRFCELTHQLSDITINKGYRLKGNTYNVKYAVNVVNLINISDNLGKKLDQHAM